MAPSTRLRRKGAAARDRKAPRRAPKQERSEETLAAILQATDLVVSDVGVERATVAMVAKRAGVSAGTLFHYFPTKAALLAAWEERVGARVIAVLAEEVERLVALAPPLEYGIRRLVHVGCALRREHHALIPKSSGASSDTGLPLARLDEALAIAARGARLLASALAGSRERELVRPKDLELAGFLALRTVTVMSYVGDARLPPGMDAEAFEDELASLVCRYLIGDAADRPRRDDLDPKKDLPTLR